MFNFHVKLNFLGNRLIDYDQILYTYSLEASKTTELQQHFSEGTKSHKLNQNFQILTILYKITCRLLFVAMVTSRRGGRGVRDKLNLIVVE